MLERRLLASATIRSSYAGLDFNASGGYTPPDTVGAAGPSSYVESVNQTLGLYTGKSTGTPRITDTFTHFWFTTGHLTRAASASFSADPIVTYDELIGRYIVGDQDVYASSSNASLDVSNFDVAVSKTSNPTDLSANSWTIFSISTTESSYDADYPGNFGYNHDAFVFTLNMFGTSSDHVQVVSVNASDLAANSSTIRSYKNDLNDFDIRPTTMHDSTHVGDPMWLVSELGDNTTIEVIKMTNLLSSSAVFSYSYLTVTPYSQTVSPKNPNGTTVTTGIDARILKSAEYNNILVATHSVSVSGTQDVAQWYKIDLSSGTPLLSDQGRISFGANTYVYYPAIDINSVGTIGMTFMKSGTDTTTDYMSAYIAGRTTTDPAGTMETPILVPAGTGLANYKDFATGGRAGDLSGINIDPINGSFWIANEFANTEASANWGTAIANYTLLSAVTLPSSIQYLRLDADGTHVDAYNNSTGTGTPAQTVLLAAASSLAITGPASADSLTVDWSNGIPLPAGGLTFTGGGSASGNSLTVIGTASANDTLVATATQISLTGILINFSNVAGLVFSPGAGTDTLSATGVKLTLAGRPGGGTHTDLFSSINIGAAGVLSVAAPVSHVNRLLVDTANLTIAGNTGAWTGTLDLTGNDLAVTSGNFATIWNQVATGYAGGQWNGSGITSSTAAGDSRHLTALGTILNNTPGLSPIYGAGTLLGPFDNASPAPPAVLVKYTYYADANLDGQVDASDYNRIDNGSLSHLSGWYNGDFNYDTTIDGSDYTLADNTFNTQGATLASQIASSPVLKLSTVPASFFSSQSPLTENNFDQLNVKRHRVVADLGL